MNNIRTTISLPYETHDFLLNTAFQKKQTLGEIIDALVKNRNSMLDKDETKRRIAEFRALCRRLSKKGKHIDFVQAVRDERDRRARRLVR